MQCPKCSERMTKAGKRMLKGKRRQAWQCQSCGHIFVEREKDED